MTNDADTAIRTALARLAPEADLDTLDPEADLQEELDLDSMDFLNFVVALSELTGVTVPERDYAAIRTYRGCREYLSARS